MSRDSRCWWFAAAALFIAACSADSDGGQAPNDAGAGVDGAPPADDAGLANADADADAPGMTDANNATDTTSADAVFQPLFNGVDFTGWDRYLGIPNGGTAALGTDNDPRGVYSLVTVDGEPAVRISGEVWGALISQKEYCSFHLRGQFKWGTLSWPPLNSQDSGIMYLSTGLLGAVNAGGDALSNPIGSGAFMVSMEYQLTPSDTGGMYNLGPISFQNAGSTVTPAQVGVWNQIEIIVQGGAAQHLLNGQPVSSGLGFRLNWPGQATQDLSCGKLQVQSEGGEIFFRRLQIAALP
ncbi:MAG TPA: DUF1080 domain-containing protein [Polyangia bacterium]|jgi:hypothetical protein